MLVLHDALLNRPVMSLRTGAQVATTIDAIINPNNLKIEGLYCQDSLSKDRLILLYQDIRDIIPQGVVINDHEVLASPEELVRLKDILNIEFDLIGKPVYTASKQRLGKVQDYATEVSTMYIQKLYISQPVYKSLAGGKLSVERANIIEITSSKIVIQDPLQPLKARTSVAPAMPAS